MAAISDDSQKAIQVALGDLKLPLGLSVAAAIAGYPAYTVIQRWRIQHAPQGTRQTSFVELFKSVKEKEGWAGLYKGSLLILPQVITTAATFGIYAFLVKPYLPTDLLAYFTARPILSSIPAATTACLVAFPFEVADARLMASSRPFSTFSPLANIRRLFTSSERNQPLRSLYTPARILAQVIPAVISGVSALAVTRAALSYPQEQRWIVKLVGQIAVSLLVTVPFDVLALRLNTERKEATSASASPKAHEADAETSVPIREESYGNVWEAFQTIVKEEGWSALWRGWPADILMIVVSNWVGNYSDDLQAVVDQSLSQSAVVA